MPSDTTQPWASDFVFSRGRVHVRKTGADLALDRTLVSEALVWLAFYLTVRLRGAFAGLGRPPGPKVWFTPEAPRPWYLIWAAATWGGVRFARSAEEADAHFYFDDSTWGAVSEPAAARGYNFRCQDISKGRVAAVFEQVAGYPLAIDPQTWSGPAVEKSEANGAHDGRIVHCPVPPQPGKVYQRLIDTVEDGCAIDLRTPCVGGRPVVVWRKRKPATRRFSIHNSAVEPLAPEAVYSADELALIARFSAAMGLDWGGLDILRDRPSGRIYIVDANKTDVGPVIALPWRAKLRATGSLAAALLALVAAPTAGVEPQALSRAVGEWTSERLP